MCRLSALWVYWHSKVFKWLISCCWRETRNIWSLSPVWNLGISFHIPSLFSLLPHLEESKINLNLIDSAPSLDIAHWVLSAPTVHFDLNKFKKGASNPEACKRLHLQTFTKYSLPIFLLLMVQNQAGVAAAAISTKHSWKPLSPSGQQLHIYNRIMRYSFGSKMCIILKKNYS